MGSFKNGLGGCFWPVVGGWFTLSGGCGSGQGRVIQVKGGWLILIHEGSLIVVQVGGACMVVQVGREARLVIVPVGGLVQVGGVGCWFMWGGEGVFQACAIWISVPNKFYVCGEKYLFLNYISDQILFIIFLKSSDCLKYGNFFFCL